MSVRDLPSGLVNAETAPVAKEEPVGADLMYAIVNKARVKEEKTLMKKYGVSTIEEVYEKERQEEHARREAQKRAKKAAEGRVKRDAEERARKKISPGGASRGHGLMSPVTSSSGSSGARSKFATEASSSIPGSLSHANLGRAGANEGRWSEPEHERFLQAVELYGKDFQQVADYVRTRTKTQCRTHHQKWQQKLAEGKALAILGGSEEQGMQSQMPKETCRRQIFCWNSRQQLQLHKLSRPPK